MFRDIIQLKALVNTVTNIQTYLDIVHTVHRGLVLIDSIASYNLKRY